VIRPGIVHRLDKDTSGLLVVAKSDNAHRSLAEQIAKKTCKREYHAVVTGIIKEDTGVISAPIGRSRNDRKKMAAVEGGREAVTEFKVLERFKKDTLVELSLQTGRTHQIRVHMAYIYHPCLGDAVYGAKTNKYGLDSQMLHAFKLSFDHPVMGERMTFTAPEPEQFLKTLERLRRETTARK